MTEDVDLVPATDRGNVAAPAAALSELGARLGVEGVDDGRPIPSTGQGHVHVAAVGFETSAGASDVAHEAVGRGRFEELLPSAVAFDIVGARVLMAALDDIIASTKAPDRAKDRAISRCCGNCAPSSRAAAPTLAEPSPSHPGCAGGVPAARRRLRPRARILGMTPAPCPEHVALARRIAAERAAAQARVAALIRDFDVIVEASADSVDDDEHDPEGATIAFERAQVGALLAAARHSAAELDDAALRLDAGTYGTCQGCGERIDVERLLARPAARACVRCA